MKLVIDQIYFIELEGTKVKVHSHKIKKSKYSVRGKGISVSSVILIRPDAFNRYLVGTGDRAMNSKRKAVSSAESPWDKLSEILQNPKTEIESVDRNGQADSYRRKFLNLLFPSHFTQSYVDCVIKDIACVYPLENENMRNNEPRRKVEYVPKKSIQLRNTGMYTNKNFILSVTLMLQNIFEYLKDYIYNKKALGKLEFIQSLASYLLRWLDINKITFYKKLLCRVFYHLYLAYHLKIALASISIQPSKFPIDVPFNETKIDQLYGNIRITGGEEEFRVSGVNLIYDKSFRSNSETRVKNILPNVGSDESFWFHGTLMKSEESIRTNGVRLSCGDAGDFSKKGNGFYLALNSDFAIEFAEGKLASKCSRLNMFAVLVFRVDNDFRKMFTGIDLTDEKELWLDATKYYRNYLQNSTLKEPKALRRLMYIEGPTSRYDGAGRKSGDFHQLCIRHKQMSEYFFSKLCCILYFKKPRVE